MIIHSGSTSPSTAMWLLLFHHSCPWTFQILNAILSKASAVCEISRENHAIFVSTKTEDAPKVTQMLLYVYGDVYKEKPLASCKIEIHAMVTQY